MLDFRRAVVLGLSFLPVLFYGRLPILRSNNELSIRVVLSALMLYFPTAYHEKLVKKDRKAIE